MSKKGERAERAIFPEQSEKFVHTAANTILQPPPAPRHQTGEICLLVLISFSCNVDPEGCKYFPCSRALYMVIKFNFIQMKSPTLRRHTHTHTGFHR